MIAADLHEHMRKTGTWVDWDHTCDGFKIGDPGTEVKGIAVAWQSTFEALREALDKGCNLFVTHEPTFYVHMDNDESLFRYPQVAAKKEFLEKSGMVVYRCHDVWDIMPEIGIVDSWARGLGYTGKPFASQKYYLVYETPERTLGGLARRIVDRTRSIGQPAVQVFGNPDKAVTRVGLGTGAITDVKVMIEMGADVVVTTDDGMSYWSAGCLVRDWGIPMIVCNHGVAEEWGIQNLAEHIQGIFSDVPVVHIPQGCSFTLV